jgi:hypothetical protein
MKEMREIKEMREMKDKDRDKDIKHRNWFFTMFVNSDGRFSSCIFISVAIVMIRSLACISWIFGKAPKPEYAFIMMKQDAWILSIGMTLQKAENIIFGVKNAQIKYKDFEINTESDTINGNGDDNNINK